MNNSRFLDYDYFLETIDKQGEILINDDTKHISEDNIIIFVLMSILIFTIAFPFLVFTCWLITHNCTERQVHPV